MQSLKVMNSTLERARAGFSTGSQGFPEPHVLAVCLCPALGFHMDFPAQHGLPGAHPGSCVCQLGVTLIPSTLTILSRSSALNLEPGDS